MSALVKSKSVELEINDTFVPAHVSLNNLKGYGDAQLKEIEATYQAIKAEKFAKSEKTGTPSITAIFGSHGTGVTTLIKKLLEQSPAMPVVGNAERFAMRLPSFSHDAAMSQAQYEIKQSIDDVREALKATTRRFLPAGKYMQDRLMAEAIKDGRSVMIAKRGRTDGGIHLLEAINKTGVSLHTILYQAPLKLKLAGFEDRYEREHDMDLAIQELVGEHSTLSDNMMALAGKAKGDLSVYFRFKGEGKVLEPIARGNQNSYHVVDQGMADRFETYFFDRDVTIKGMMGDRTALPNGMLSKPVNFEMV